MLNEEKIIELLESIKSHLSDISFFLLLLLITTCGK